MNWWPKIWWGRSSSPKTNTKIKQNCEKSHKPMRGKKSPLLRVAMRQAGCPSRTFVVLLFRFFLPAWQFLSLALNVIFLSSFPFFFPVSFLLTGFAVPSYERCLVIIWVGSFCSPHPVSVKLIAAIVGNTLYWSQNAQSVQFKFGISLISNCFLVFTTSS